MRPLRPIRPWILCVALALALAGCADADFVAEYGALPPASPGVSAWFVAGGGSIWHTADGGARWERQLQGAPHELIDVAFVDALHGWAVGVKGLILGTSDGGDTWATQSSAGANLWEVAGADASHVWALGANGALLRSEDGGSTWHAMQLDDVDLVESNGGGIAFADARHGWIAAGDAVRSSADGGATWTVQYRHSGFELHAVACGDARHVWAVGVRKSARGSPLILASSDGGASWSVQDPGRKASSIADFPLSSVTAADSTHVWAASNLKGFVLVSSDGGGVWKLVDVSSTLAGESLAAADASHVLLTTGGQPVMVSGDGGLTWAASGRSSWLGDGEARGIAAVLTRAQ